MLSHIRANFPTLTLRLVADRLNSAPKRRFPALPAETEPQIPTVEEQNLLLRAIVRKIVFDRVHDRFFIHYHL